MKVVATIMGLTPSGWPRNMCLICLWDMWHTVAQYTKKDWPLRDEYTIGKSNVINSPLVSREKILIPPLHVKLGLVTNFVKSFIKTNDASKTCLRQMFPKLSAAKIEAGIFNGPDIRKMLKSEEFTKILDTNAAIAWSALKVVITEVLGRHRHEKFRECVDNLMQAFSKANVNMSLKVHLMHAHLDWFERQLPTESDDQGERFHQTAVSMEARYKGKKLNAMIADICWCLKVTDESLDEDDQTEENEGNDLVSNSTSN